MESNIFEPIPDVFSGEPASDKREVSKPEPQRGDVFAKKKEPSADPRIERELREIERMPDSNEKLSKAKALLKKVYEDRAVLAGTHAGRARGWDQGRK